MLRELDSKWLVKVETTCKAGGIEATPLMKVRPTTEGAKRIERAIRALAWEYFHHADQNTEEPPILMINRMYLKGLYFSFNL